MTKAYFTKRLHEALSLANEAPNNKERNAYLRAARYYCDLLGLNRLPAIDPESLAD